MLQLRRGAGGDDGLGGISTAMCQEIEASSRRWSDEPGFTLVELSIVVTIIAVLVSIAIPAFLGVRRHGQDRAAQSSLRTAYTNAKVLFTDDQDYRDATAAALQGAESSLRFVERNRESAGPDVISVNPVSAVQWVAVAKSESGTCFALVASVTDAATRYGRSTNGTCRAIAGWAQTASDLSW